ncbi:Regulator [Vibrio aestuarianus]|nr:Regulator [Vibrio aestuarianus]
MKYHEMSKNYVFREFECGLTTEETANLCFKSVSEVKKWDGGKRIPDVCRRIMRMQNCNKLSHLQQWEGFKMKNKLLELPTGQQVTPQEILTGIALIQIESEIELKTTTKLLSLARSIARVKERV